MEGREKGLPAIHLGPGEAAWAVDRVVAGLPLLVRTVKQLERAGARGVVVTISSGEREPTELRAILDRYGVGANVEEATAPPAGALRAAAIYDPSVLAAWVGSGSIPEPTLVVQDDDGVATADAHLWESIRKTVAHDGPVAYYLARPISGRISRLLLRLAVRPNPVTVFGIFVGAGAGASMALGGYAAVLLGALLFFFGLVLDCIDGELARLTLSTSRFGQWIDTIADDLSVVAVTVGIGIGIFREGGHPLFLWASLAAGGMLICGQGYIYAWLARSGGVIDTAKYPWFFSGGEGVAAEGKRSLFGYLTVLTRRDGQSLALVVLAAAGFDAVIFVALAGGAAGYFVLLILDRILKAFGVAREPA